MFIDITLEVTPKMVSTAQENESKTFVGHLGTHFDCMDKKFPLEYIQRNAIIFDVSKVKDRDISMEDIDFDLIQKDMFVGFYTGFIEEVGYGNQTYFRDHPQLSNEILGALMKHGISIIGIDFAGVRRGIEHTPMDQICANQNVFVIENLCNLKTVLKDQKYTICKMHTYPMKFSEMSGLPCRVVAEV